MFWKTVCAMASESKFPKVPSYWKYKCGSCWTGSNFTLGSDTGRRDITNEYTYIVELKYHTKIKLGSRHCGTLVLDTEQLLQNFWKRVGWKQSVNGLMSVGQQRNESQVAVGQKQHEQRKMLDTLSCWLAKIEHWLWCCATSLNY